MANMKFFKKFVNILIHLALIITIVNNGNILTGKRLRDSERGRITLQISKIHKKYIQRTYI